MPAWPDGGQVSVLAQTNGQRRAERPRSTLRMAEDQRCLDIGGVQPGQPGRSGVAGSGRRRLARLRRARPARCDACG